MRLTGGMCAAVRRSHTIVAPRRLALCIGAFAALAGCAPGPSRSHGAAPGGPVTVAPGVAYRQDTCDAGAGRCRVWSLDIDLRSAGVRAEVAAGQAAPEGGVVMADSRTVRDWCAQRGALGAINGGFFGVTRAPRKEVIGLLARDGTVLSGGRLVRARGSGARWFARSVLSFDRAGLPHIGWCVARRGAAALLTEYEAPTDPHILRRLRAVSAVACGPRLVAGARPRVCDREERLVSPPSVPRTFVAYDTQHGKPRHLLLAVGSAMTYADASTYAQRHFERVHGTVCAEAMCLDGGGSSQLVYWNGETYEQPYGAPVTVPTAVIVRSRPPAR
jgi:exopolysaccharide biosynthesis protein